MSYFLNNPKDPFPMSSNEARALEESVLNKSSRRLRIAASASESSSSTEYNSSDDSYNSEDELDDITEIFWTSMATESEERGPSAAAIARIRGGGGKEGLVSGGKKSKKSSASGGDDLVTATTAAVMDDGDDDEDDDDNDEDEFLDRPVYESRARGLSKVLVNMNLLLERVVHRLYGDSLPIEEFIRTVTLASTLFFMIGGYWLLRSLKDPVITALCGVSVIPKAKMLSVFIVLGVVSVYNYLLDTDIPKHKLFYLFGTFYFCLFTFIALMLTHPTYGLANEQPNPNRILGWVSYCSIESFGSVMVTLFWSFANSNISLEAAKSSYGLMVATAQIGSILGPTFVQYAAPKIGVAPCYLMGACSMLLLQGSMYTYVSVYGTHTRGGGKENSAPIVAKPKVVDPSSPIKKKEKAGILEGLVLLYKHNYVKGIFAISCMFMIEVTILDYTMKVLARDYFASEYECEYGMSCYNPITNEHGMSQEATAAFSSFMGFFGQATNMLSFTLSLFGTSAVIRHLGLRLTLLLFPSLCLAVIVFVRLYPTLYVVFGAMMILKANSYALNNPTKEILYQPTSGAIKYKAKSWIDIFGDRLAKAMGSVITNAFSDSAARLISNGSVFGMIVATFLIWNATFMGRKFDEYTSTGYVVGGDNNDSDSDSKNLHMAIQQNDNKDTSCAILLADGHEDDAEVGLEEEGQSEDGSEVDDGEADDKDFAKKPDVVMV